MQVKKQVRTGHGTMDWFKIGKGSHQGSILFPCLSDFYAELPLLMFNRQVMSDSVTPWTAECQISLSFTVSRSLLKLMFIESAMPFSHLILCHPILFLPSIFPSIRVFSNELAYLYQVLKVLELQLQSFQ